MVLLCGCGSFCSAGGYGDIAPRSTVRRPAEERARRAQPRPIRRWVFARLAEEPPEPPPGVLAIDRRLVAEPEAPREPAEERREEPLPPAPQTLPRAPDRAGIDLEAERRPDGVLHEPADEAESERLEDHPRRVPVPRMKQVRQHADRPLAREAQVAPDRDLEPPLAHAEDLPRVDAVAHDPQPVRKGGLPADEAPARSQRRHRR